MRKILLLIQFVGLAMLLKAQLHIKLELFSSGYSSPVGVENCGDSRLFIVQQTGKSS